MEGVEKNANDPLLVDKGEGGSLKVDKRWGGRGLPWCWEGLPWPWKVWSAQGLSKNISHLGVRDIIPPPLMRAPPGPPHRAPPIGV